MVEFYLKCTNIVDCMRDYGITNMSKDGDWNDEVSSQNKKKR